MAVGVAVGAAETSSVPILYSSASPAVSVPLSPVVVTTKVLPLPAIVTLPAKLLMPLTPTPCAIQLPSTSSRIVTSATCMPSTIISVPIATVLPSLDIETLSTVTLPSKRPNAAMLGFCWTH